MQISIDNTDRVIISVHGFNENEMKLLENKYDKLRKLDEPEWLTIKLINNIEVTFFKTAWEENKNG